MISKISATFLSTLHLTSKQSNSSFQSYAILGACNPPLANNALSTDSSVGLLLPCNIIVESLEDGSTIDQIAYPQVIMTAGQFSHPILTEVAQQAAEPLRRVAESLKRIQI